MKWFILLALLGSTQGFALCPSLVPDPVRITIKHQQQPQAAELIIDESAAGLQRLQLRLSQHRLPIASLELLFANTALQVQASPLVEDANLDGLADHIWLLSREGLLWRIAISAGQFSEPQLMADLSDSALDFIAAVALLRSRLPSILAPLAWRHTDQQLILLVGRHRLTGNDSLLMLRFNAGVSAGGITHFAHLADRTELSDKEQSQHLSAGDWRALLAKAGWQIQLPGKISATPTVVAGVIYAAVATTASAEACVSTDTEQLLYALHLHTATTVYATRSKPVPYLADAQLSLRQQANKQLKLVLQNEQQALVVQPNLLKISAECHNCTEPLSLDKFPLWKRLATYRSEQGAY